VDTGIAHGGGGGHLLEHVDKWYRKWSRVMLRAALSTRRVYGRGTHTRIGAGAGAGAG
jgi:hypothetical protein